MIQKVRQGNVATNTASKLSTEQAEHHARALKNVPGVTFYRDEKRGRIGMLTTVEVKHAMCTLLNAMMR